MTKGYVYILKNQSMPGLLKIGKTTRSVQQRANELWQTGVPTPFEVVEQVRSPDCGELEAWVHKGLAQFRVSSGREFFAVQEERAIRELGNWHNEQIKLLVDEFKPDHVLIESEMYVDPGHMSFLAYEVGLHPFELVDALNYLQPSDLDHVIDRWKDICARRRAARDQDTAGPVQ